MQRRVVLHVSVYKRAGKADGEGYYLHCTMFIPSLVPRPFPPPMPLYMCEKRALIARDLLSSRTAGSSRVARGHC